ncbi:MAG: DUF2282 domain-containing protein [Pseudomonadales bacterium]|nr:DUF2282 domain-containing protein [Pseudomonadales bacterium]NRA16156.1 DUF2282 domain-containing protein [Oceanospirillaceae bacterium]
MSKTNLVAATAITGIIAMGATMISSPAMAGSKERCYGVAAAGQNDCATANSSCAGTSKVDNQGDAFVAIAKGLCEKLAGGSLKPKA